MPTVLRQFPEIARSGTQQTPYVQLPAGLDTLHLVGQASVAVLSDPANTVIFTILASPTGSDADAQVLIIEPWLGGTHLSKTGDATLPNLIDVGFGLDARRATDQVSLRAVFSRSMVVGATLTGLP